MDFPQRKIFLGALVILALLVLGFFLYRYLLPEGAGQISEEQTISGGSGGLGGIGQGEEEGTPIGNQIISDPQVAKKLFQLADFSVIGAGINKNNQKVYFYQKEGGDLFAVDFEGKQEEKVSHITILGLFDARWSTAGDKSAVFYLDGETVKSFLQTGSSSVTALPQNVQSFSWSPDGKSLAYLVKKDAENLSLITADSQLKSSRTIFTTPITDAHLNWASSDSIILSTAPSGLAEGYIFKYSRASGSFVKILGPRFGLEGFWSPEGTRFLATFTDSSGQKLSSSIHDSSGKELFQISMATLPDKCAWNGNEEIFCAIPREIPEGTIWPDDYYRGELNTQDMIVSLNLKTKGVRKVFNDGNFDVSNLLISPNKDYLIFVNRVDGTPWSFKLGN